MPDVRVLGAFLGGAHVDAAVLALRPDYRAVLLAVDGLVPGPSDEASDALLRAAEGAVREMLGDRPVDELPRVAHKPSPAQLLERIRVTRRCVQFVPLATEPIGHGIQYVAIVINQQ